ncbi:hypothetical protein BB558_006457 [Smittium angustum]|uniref:glucan endo-1,3-beta-D-glucosidase n=1 Tax=Smittium angustum TaxID=133377 RepID=A0A2U1IXP4_SMIAN|nr:hypothetical protein BB558_006457 [Smittium angustum]
MLSAAFILSCSLGIVFGNPIHLTPEQTNVTNKRNDIGSLSNRFWGINYSPYNNDGTCIGYTGILDQMKELSLITKRIKLYSTDCNQLDYVVKAIRENNLNLEVHAGVWATEGLNRTSREIDEIIKVMKEHNNPGIVKDVSIGNEELFKKKNITENKLIDFIKLAKSKFSSSGYGHLKVFTTEVVGFLTERVINECDIVQINAHVMYDSEFHGIENSVGSLFERIKTISAINPQNKLVRLGEVGYASRGSSIAHNGTLERFREFANKFTCSAKRNQQQYFYFESKDSIWKVDSDVSRSYGLYDLNFKPKIDFVSMGYCT